MDLKQLEVLRAIAETGSFRAAADRLLLTQPAISHHLKRLEEELDETLVLRSKPRVALSAAGTEVLEVARGVLDSLDALRQRFQPGHDLEVKGALRVTASPLGIVYLYGDLLEKFIAEHPGIEVILTAVETPLDGARQVLARRDDAAFVPFPVDMPQLAQVELGVTDHVVITAADHPLARSGSLTVSQIRSYPFVRYLTGAGSRLVSDLLFGKPERYGNILLESNDTEFVKRIVGLGLAIALVPRFTVLEEVREGRLRALGIRGRKLAQTFGLVHRRDMRSRALRTFLEFCERNRGLIPV